MYKVTKVDGEFLVIETANDQVLMSCSSHEEAHAFYRKLKGGRGFQGNTPPFFLKRFKIAKEA